MFYIKGNTMGMCISHHTNPFLYHLTSLHIKLIKNNKQQLEQIICLLLKIITNSYLSSVMVVSPVMEVHILC